MITLALLSLSALGAERLDGDKIRVAYGDVGLWNDKTTAFGFQGHHGDAWVDYTFPGLPYAAWFLAWEDGGSAPEAYFAESSTPESNATLVAREDLSTADMRVARHTWQVGAVKMRRTEAWAVDGATVLVHVYVVSEDTRALSKLRLLYAADPDQDYVSHGTTNTLDDTRVGEGGAVVTATGPATGHTLAFAACDRDAEVGTHAGWPSNRSVDVPLIDEDGAESDSALGIRLHAASTLTAPGDAAVFSFLVGIGDSADGAVAELAAHRDLCVACDADADGWLAADCGGTDCDDDDPGANPDQTEVWYDGVDGDCDGASDDDADLDGYDAVAQGGDDCDDADPARHPGVEDVPYDGIDADCDGASDYDGDGDGHDSAGLGGDDCNDADAAVYPGADDTDGDGVDADCDGADGPAADPELVGACGCAAGASTPVWPLLGLLFAVRRRRAL